MVKKRRAKRRPWNKGREVGKKGALTPAQVKRIRQVLVARGAPGLRDLALFQVAVDTMMHGPDLFNLTVKQVQLPTSRCSFPTVKSVQLSKSHAKAECRRSDAPSPRRQPPHLENGSPCLARGVEITFSQAGAPGLLVQWGFDT